jgi:hypothetical protein
MVNSDAGSEHRDALPADLDADAAAFAGAYQFPDNSRRRIPGLIYLAIALTCLAVWRFVDAPVVNSGFAWAAILLGLVGVFSLGSGWRMHVDEKQALVAAHRAAGFPVGHASAQQVWHGLRSRPTWRVLAYSAEEPPTRRALVLVDAVDGHVVEHLVQPVDDPPHDARPADGAEADR